MNFKIFYTCISIAIFFSCSNSSKMESSWKTIHIGPLSHQNANFDFINFKNQTSIFLTGSGFSDIDLINKRFDKINAFIYYTFDSGTNWIEKDFGYGQMTAINTSNDRVLVTKTVKINNSGRLATDFSEIYSFSDSPTTWKSIAILKSTFIRNIFSNNNRFIYVISKHDNDSFWTLKKMSNQDNVWVDVGSLPNCLTSPVMVDDNLLFICEDRVNSIKSFSFQNSRLENINLPDPKFVPTVINFTNGKIFVAGQLGGKICLYEFLFASKEWRIVGSIEKVNSFPICVHSFAKRIIVLVGERGPIGVNYILYNKDLNNENRWSTEGIPSSYFKPFAFNNQILIGCSYQKLFYKDLQETP